MTLQQLREKRAQLVEDMESILASAEEEGRLELNEEEAELYAEAEQKLEQIKAAISRKEGLQSEKSKLEEPEPAATKGQGADAPVPGPEAKKDFDTVGEFIGAVVKHYRGGKDDPRLTWQDNEIGAATQEMGTGSAGGFMVPNQFRDTLLKIDPQGSIIESRSNVIAAGDPPDAAITMPALDQSGSTDNVYGGVSVEWIGEGDTKPETDADIREVSLQPHEIAAHVPFTDKLMRNAPAFTQQVETLMRQALIAAREQAFFSGDGVAKPLGMLNAGATYAQSRDTNNEVNYVDLANMVSRLHMDGGQPYWLITQAAMTQILQLADPNGNYVWQPNAVEGSPMSLFGFPVFWHQRSPTLGNEGDVMLCNTNPYYMVKDGSGPFVSMGFINDDFTKNRTRIKVFHNVDAKPWLTEPFTQEGGFEVSPFVKLQA